jgi:hypothetical protein
MKRPFAIVATILTSVMACSSDGVPSLIGVDAEDVVFLTQSEPQAAYMDALFTGSVIVDEAKCTRLVDAERATVIWPPGFTVRGEDGALVVTKGDGQNVGILGGSFMIGGGLVSQLNPELQISYVDRARAQESCPGMYWIASEVQPVR